MFHHVNTILLSAAGAVVVAAFLARRIMWKRANGPSITPTTARFVLGVAALMPRFAVVDDDTGVITISGPCEYEHEGTTEQLTPGRDLARVPERKIGLTSRERAEQERHAEREVSRMFERFDRMMTNGMAHVDTICAATIQRWIDEADAEAELADLRVWLTAERPIVEREYAHALLIS